MRLSSEELRRPETEIVQEFLERLPDDDLPPWRACDSVSAEVEHIRGDPHFAESIRNDLADRAWDVAVVTYGRIRLIADHLAGRTDRLVTIGGWPVLKGWFHIQDGTGADPMVRFRSWHRRNILGRRRASTDSSTGCLKARN